MANVIKLVQGDSRPVLAVVLTDKTTNAPINLTGASLALKFRVSGADTLIATISGSVVDALAGACVFDWSTAPHALDGEPGNYEGEVEITFSDSTIQTVYDILYFYLRAQF